MSMAEFDWKSLPFVATLPPPNPALIAPDRDAANRIVNEGIVTMAAEEGAFLVDLHGAFMQAGDPPSLYSDHIHPSDAGYRLIAETFFEAIAYGRSTPEAASQALSFGWSPTPHD